MATEAYVFDAIRTPRGRGKENGALHNTAPVELLRQSFVAMKERNDLDTSQVDDVILGCVTPVNDQGSDIAKTATLYAGWDLDVPGMQINRFCASGLETCNTAAMKVRSGWENLLVAGGVESMSRVAMGSDGGAMLDPEVAGKLKFVPQGISADLIATLEGFSREDVDTYAAQSQKRAARATEEGRFKKSIIPVRNNGDMVLEKDEHIRPGTTVEVLSELKPAFEMMGEQMGFDAIALSKYPEAGQKINHVHTGGNSSGIVDGAALVLIGSDEKGKELGLKPRARIRSAALVGTEPTIMLVGPAPASKKALKLAGMTLDDIDLIEINEAFAVVVLRFMKDMGINDCEKLNVNGGAIAMGHPLGATGAMILGTMIDELERQDKNTALLTLCVGGGMGIATVIERV